MRNSVAALVALIGIGTICAAVFALLVIFGGRELRHKTQASLLAATPAIAGDELRSRGHYLANPLACDNMPGFTKRRMRVSCLGKTTDNKRVQVLGAAEDRVKEEYFTILVNGRPVVQNAHCLGPDCRKKD